MAKERENLNRIVNCIPSREKEKDWQFDSAVQSKALTLAKKLPKECDLREDWWEVGDQGETGSCVGWASVDGVFRWHFVKANCIPSEKLLSVRFVWMGAKETDEFRERPTSFLEQEGTSLKAALDMARKYGNVPDEVLPFKETSCMSGEDPDVFYSIASQFKIAGYYNLRREKSKWQDVVSKWRKWMASGGGPILSALGVDDTWDNAKDTNGDLDLYHPDTVRGGHAITIVGFTPDRFIIRNSWGDKAWGDKGFGYASLDYAEQAFFEAYGVKL